VDQVERTLREVLRAQVVAEHPQVRERELGQPTGVQVGRGHLAARSDMAAEPARNRPPAAAHLQAAGPGDELEPLDAMNRRRVEPFLQQLQATALVGSSVRERVSLVGVGHRRPLSWCVRAPQPEGVGLHAR